MKTLLAFLLGLSFNVICFGQTNEQVKPEPKPEQAILQKQTVDLPLPKRGDWRPVLTLQDALKLAETYIAKQGIKISPYYLYEAKYMLYGSKNDQEPCWFFWWVNENGTIGDYVYIVISIKTRNIRRLPSM